jgi:hypothetical protein
MPVSPSDESDAPSGTPDTPEPVSGVWVTFYTDRSAARVWSTEVEALRDAVDWSRHCEFRPFGADIFTGAPS